MTHNITGAFLNSVLLVMDSQSGVIPESMGGNSVVSSSSCIAVGTLSEMDGETCVTFTDEKGWKPAESNFQEVFSSTLDTPRKEISICSIELNPLATITVADTTCAVRIYANDDREPDKIGVVISSAP